MTALYIILAIAAVLTALLCLTAGVVFRYDDGGLNVRICVGMLEITVVPKRKKKIGVTKLSRKLRGKRISDMVFEDAKTDKSEGKKKEKKKLKFARTGNRFEDFISAVSEMTDEPESLRLLLIALKNLAADFKKALKIKIDSLKAEIDTGDAAKTCLCCASLSALLSCFLEFAHNFTDLVPVRDGAVGIYPSFGEGCRFDIRITVKIRLISVLKAFFRSMIDNSKIKKQTISPKERKIK